MQLDGETVWLDIDGGQFSWGEVRDHLRVGEDSNLTTRIFAGSGRSVFDVVGGYAAFATLGRRLPAFPRPFRDWAGLSDFLGLDHAIDGHRASTFEVVMPTYARIVRRRMNPDDELVVNVEATEPIGELALVVTPDNPSEEPLRVPGTSWIAKDYGEYVIGARCHDLVGPVTLQLVAHGEEVQTVRAGVPTLAARAHAVLDQSGWLRGLLGLRPGADGKTTANGFQVGVANLLSLSGFKTIDYSHKSRTSFPDVVAVITETCLLVGECTIEAPDRDKLLSLSQRADAIRERAQQRHREITLLRVVFTARPRSEVSQAVLELAAGHEGSAAIIAHEELAQLLGMASNGEHPSTVANAILTWVNPYGGYRL